MALREFVRGNILKMRKARKWGQAELAERAKMSQSAIQKYESGERYPEPEAMEALCEALGCTMDALVLEDGAARDFKIIAKNALKVLSEQLDKGLLDAGWAKATPDQSLAKKLGRLDKDALEAIESQIDAFLNHGQDRIDEDDESA